MRTDRALPALLAGLLLFDVLVNLPGFTPASPLASLLAPTIDLLVIVAVCMGIAQAGEGARRPLRIALGVLVAALVASAAGLRFGFDIASRLVAGGSANGSGAGGWGAAAGWAACAAILAGFGLASFLLSGLLIRGLQSRIVRSIMLLLIALAAVLQVISGRRLFGPSVVPRLIALVGML
jgi:hypothetical protein